MRLSTDANRDDDRALATIAAAADAGVTVFDTARSYGHGDHDLGHNERLLARALRAAGADATARIVTKGGMARRGDAWVADGRAKAIRADCEASLGALDGLRIDLFLLHAPDPRTPWTTSVRALARLLQDGLVERAGVANVNRAQLDEALALAPITAVQVALSPFDDRALRSGLLDRCEEAGVTLIAHSPLGGPRRAPTLTRQEALTDIADAHDATPAELVLAWLLDLSSRIVAVPGARRPETATSAARAATLELGRDARDRLRAALGDRTRPSHARAPARDGGDVVLVMGIPGAGKTSIAKDYASRGYARLNRDERGGTLRELAGLLDDALRDGVRRVVLDNTYLTRADRSHVVDAAARQGLSVRCVWVDTPLAQAQVNMVERLLDLYGSLPGPTRLKELARREPGVLTPTSQMRALRELEPPTDDEGFTAIERVPFVRSPSRARDGVGAFVAAAVLDDEKWRVAVEGTSAALVFDWRPEGSATDLADAVARVSAVVAGPVDGSVCPHGGGPPVCWCRPPLPGLALAFARAHGVDASRSVLVGRSTAHRALATALGAGFAEA